MILLRYSFKHCSASQFPIYLTTAFYHLPILSLTVPVCVASTVSSRTSISPINRTIGEEECGRKSIDRMTRLAQFACIYPTRYTILQALAPPSLVTVAGTLSQACSYNQFFFLFLFWGVSPVSPDLKPFSSFSSSIRNPPPPKKKQQKKNKKKTKKKKKKTSSIFHVYYNFSYSVIF